MVIRWEPLAVKQLKSIYHPRMGQIEESAKLQETSDEFRALVVAHHYKIIYLIDDPVIVIFSIWDTRQDPGMLRKLLHE